MTQCFLLPTDMYILYLIQKTATLKQEQGPSGPQRSGKKLNPHTSFASNNLAAELLSPTRNYLPQPNSLDGGWRNTRRGYNPADKEREEHLSRQMFPLMERNLI